MRKHKALPPRRESRVVSQYIPADGSIVIGVAKGWTGSGEVLYRLEAEKLAGAIEDRKELAVIVNNLGLLVLAQLCQFNLAENLTELPKALAKWAHIDMKALKAEDEKDQIAEALAIAQKTLRDKHANHGHGTADDGPSDSDCGCRGGADQMICASAGCGFCLAQKDIDEGRSADSATARDDADGGEEGPGGGADSPGAGPSTGLAPDEQRA